MGPGVVDDFAKKLLAEAGYPNGLETDLWAMPVQRPYNPNGKRIAEMMQSDLAKIGAGKKLSPILLVRGAADGSTPLQIADGYHRVCASYVRDENTDIPCRLVSWQ